MKHDLKGFEKLENGLTRLTCSCGEPFVGRPGGATVHGLFAAHVRNPPIGWMVMVDLDGADGPCAATFTDTFVHATIEAASIALRAVEYAYENARIVELRAAS